MTAWRLLDTGVRSAAENMALDEVILTAKARGWVPNTLRFLQFNPPCVLVGYHQSVEQEVRLSYCRQQGIEVNRRITGGGALYWDETQLGWEIIAEKNHPAMPARIEELYSKLSGAVVSALQELGVEARFRPRNDIEVKRRKISGTGGTELEGAFLFQGTLLIDFEVETMLKALRIPTEKLKDKELASVRERVTCLQWELGYTPLLETVKALLAANFARLLGVSFAPGPLTRQEAELFAAVLPKFQSEGWIDKVRKSPWQRQALRSLYKNKGGLLRTSLVLDSMARRIESVYLTGDFFVYPQNAVFDLENALKGSSARYEEIVKTVNKFFAAHQVCIPGLGPGDFVQALWEAVRKGDWVRQGIGQEDVNSLFTVAGTLETMAPPQVLLLPYCAKKPGCRYRYEEGCSLCGACTVGQAYQLARKYDLQPVTIQNYEMLEDTLRELKKGGHSSFLGTCCEAFYAKHKDDFERIGLPGILVDVDNSTCYELGEEAKAYAGKFENQTDLKLELLEQVIKIKVVKQKERTGCL